jgi:hypothetical protein
MDLAHEPLLGRVPAGTVHEQDLAPGALELFDHDVLVGIVAGQSVGGQDQDLVELSTSGGIPELVQARPIQPSAAVAVVDEPILGDEVEHVLGRVRLQRGELALDRALLLLLSGGNPSIQRRGAVHERAPSFLDGSAPALGQSTGRLHSRRQNARRRRWAASRRGTALRTTRRDR